MPTNIAIRCKPVLILLLLMGLGACSKLLDVQQPPNEIGVDRAFKDSSSAVAAISGIYNLMISHGHFEWSGLSYNTARSADEAEYNFDTDFFTRNSLLYTDNEVYSMWTQGFSSLLLINTCLKGLQSATLSPTLYRQLLGEALFSRAFVNFYLVNIWGDAIPLITSPEVDVNQFAKSVPREQLYTQIITDLLQAQGLLTNTYPSAGRVRPNLMAATALLARVYLYRGRYNEAIAQASTVIGSNLYSPLPPPAMAFEISSTEAIWQLMPPKDLQAGWLAPVGDAPIYQQSATYLSAGLLAAFEPGDLRRQLWVTNNTFMGYDYIIPYKYKSLGPDSPGFPVEYYIVLRLAEQYLIRAEARVRLGQTAAAIEDLDIVRARAGLPALPPNLTAQQCMHAVEQERRVELFTEWGHRWLDLRRWPGINDPGVTRADEVLGSTKPDWQPTDIWYPVPAAELQLNKFLVQNPGYPSQ